MISLPIILLANALNQYTSRTVPGYASLRGEAATNATVTVNERPTFRQGSFFYGSDSADNTTSNLWKELEVYAAINPPGTNTSDVVYSSTGTVFIARTPETFTYDADGNMTSDGRFHYTWNGENRLVCASNAEVVVTYAYDHRGRMVRKEISHEGTKTRRIEYLWDDWNIIREIQWPVASDQWSVGTLATGHCPLVTDYVWGLDIDGTPQGAGGVGGLLAVIRSNSNSNSALYFPTYDANGNISEYVSTNGEIVAHYDYSPFGEPLVASGPLAATFTHQFSTKPYCAVTGFSEYQMRKYRPEIGRWMSRDPIGDDEPPLPDDHPKDSLSFQFNSNNAIWFYDILGMATAPWGPITPWNLLPLPNPCPKRCCFGKLIQLVPIWNCTRKLAGVVEIGPVKHGYICCGGYNVNCFGIQKYRPSCMKLYEEVPCFWNKEIRMQGEVLFKYGRPN